MLKGKRENMGRGVGRLVSVALRCPLTPMEPSSEEANEMLLGVHRDLHPEGRVGVQGMGMRGRRVSKYVTLLKGENENRYMNKAIEAVSEARACRKSR